MPSKMYQLLILLGKLFIFNKFDRYIADLKSRKNWIQISAEKFTHDKYHPTQEIEIFGIDAKNKNYKPLIIIETPGFDGSIKDLTLIE